MKTLLSFALLLLISFVPTANAGRFQVPEADACPPGFLIEARMFTDSPGGWTPEIVDGKIVRLVPTHLGRAFDQFRASFGCTSRDTCYNIFMDLDHDGVVGTRDFGLFRRAWNNSQVVDRGTWAKTTWSARANPGECKQVNFPSTYNPAKNLFVACVDPSTGAALEGRVGTDTYYWRGPAVRANCTP